MSARPLQLAILLVLTANLQAQPKSPEFDAATVKRSPPPAGDSIMINLGTALNGKVVLTNVTLADCIKFAYGIVADAQLAGPEWINSGTQRYDVVAEAPGTTPREALLQMLQTLLADRMKLVLHREQRELRYVALIAGKGPPKLIPSKPGAVPAVPSLPGHIITPEMSLSTLAKLLSRFERQTVLDKTGLDGTFEIHLEWSPNATDKQESQTATAPSLFTAVQEQLGLKLETRKGPVEILVVDSAEKIPTEN